jgi:hypothetical protein
MFVLLSPFHALRPHFRTRDILTMKTAAALALVASVLGGADAFAPLMASGRSATALNSHLSIVQTRLMNKEHLQKALVDMGLSVNVAGKGEQVAVNGYKGETASADIAIPQRNGHDIGFRYNGETYELVSDLQFWDQSVPVSFFLDKVHQRYSVNTILATSAADGFTTDNYNTVDDTITIQLSGYNTANTATAF